MRASKSMEQDLRGQGPSSTSKIRNPGAAKGLNHKELGHGGTTFQRLRGKQFAITCVLIEKQDHTNYMEHFNDDRILGLFSNHVISVDNFGTLSFTLIQML